MLAKRARKSCSTHGLEPPAVGTVPCSSQAGPPLRSSASISASFQPAPSPSDERPPATFVNTLGDSRQRSSPSLAAASSTSLGDSRQRSSPSTSAVPPTQVPGDTRVPAPVPMLPSCSYSRECQNLPKVSRGSWATQHLRRPCFVKWPCAPTARHQSLHRPPYGMFLEQLLRPLAAPRLAPLLSRHPIREHQLSTTKFEAPCRRWS